MSKVISYICGWLQPVERLSDLGPGWGRIRRQRAIPDADFGLALGHLLRPDAGCTTEPTREGQSTQIVDKKKIAPHPIQTNIIADLAREQIRLAPNYR